MRPVVIMLLIFLLAVTLATAILGSAGTTHPTTGSGDMVGIYRLYTRTFRASGLRLRQFPVRQLDL